ncbi:amino acid adenylation domain-containing protein [Pseudoalteromonas luteoviolacea]|uniref:non-ribosomal peptide synthetase n=1 Tax=Pseudoalteromonas luteoviolacea TaxID=43657 RepID=UPI001F1CE543|nr:non-ribosomal peptide synthetase [Pseudoalteromonas luteoviolacea]MCF6438846.1 amino acid adenylation domain-containing protein [Pseudoalteromonas luteoviolacea]
MKNKQDTTANKHTSAQQEIAIVGISLRFPGASSKEQFWHNLANKVSSISEIPAARFRWQDDFDPTPKKDEQKIVSKWGGFIDNIDGFDAGFFAISPKEAQSMDPQQRLSMELAWQCFEDAGLSPSTFKNTKTGVYLGCSNTDYQELATGNIDPHFLTGMSTGVFANRISHYFNFQGPSETVDTACSSSLVALHKAMNDFNAGEINAALVGGVNLLITKSRYVSFSKLGVLSPNGRCKTLDANADGYVRGEGVGMVLLMPLERAVKENLTVYGVVKGSSVGHSGHTNTLTSPSPFSQSRVIQEAIDNAGIHSDDLSYIELHGTGTRLGDPIEIQGLKRAFRATKSKETDGNSACYLSTVKTNIGHLESTAGIAGIIKVLLSFKHQQVPPLQNFETLNPKITLDKSPFALATDCVPLEQKHVLAGISSFGFAGVNAHVILQSPPAQIATPINLGAPAGIMLSAKKPEALMARAKALKAFIEAQNLTDDNLADLAFTLQVGREGMSQRLAFSASSMTEVKAQLNLFIEGKSGTWQQGKADKDNASTCITADNQNTSDALSQWLSGATVEWSALYTDAKPQRLALPGYPFNPKPYWITSKKDAPTTEVLHPLLHKALPAFDELLFSSTFTGDEFFLADHQINGERLLPGVCTFEMVRAAIALSHNLDASHTIQIKNVKWLRPISIEQGTSTEQNTVYVSLWQSDSAMQFEVWQKHEGEQQVSASGEMQVSQHSAPVTLFELTTESDQLLSPSDAYATFKNMGIDYGPRFQGLQQLSKQGITATAKVAVPSSCSQGFGLSPALVDAALQSLIIFADQSHAALPFATEQVCFYNAQQLNEAQHTEVWVKATQTSNGTDNTQKFDLDICDLDGNLLMGIKGFSTRTVPLDAVKPSTQDLLTLTPCWQAVTPDFATSPELHAAYFGPQALKPDWLTEGTDTNQLVWLAQDEYAQPLALFQQLKRMLADGFDSKPLSITLVTKQTQAVFGQNEQTNCEGAGLIGLLQSVAQEYPSWTVRIIDAEQLDSLPSEFTAQPAGLYAHRTGQYFSFELAQHTYLDAAANNASLQKRGTYLVLGGAGGLGQVWSEWMIKHHDAQIIWLGRRELNTDIQSDIDRLAKLGKAPVYIQCDASDKDAMESASKSITSQFGGLNGVVHSILHLEDQTLANMDDAQFNRSYHAKQQTGEVALEVFSQADLDFFLFFSSMQSFSPAAGQSNYAAGCVYLDSLARTYQHKCPVKIINWGYWGSVGVVQDEYYQKKMMAMGIGSIEAEQGMQALATLMGSNLTQAGVLKITQAALTDTFKLQSFSAQGAQHAFAKQSSEHQAPKQDSKAQVDLNPLCAALCQAGWQHPAQREQALAILPEYFSKWWTETERYLEAHQLMKNGVIKTVEAVHNSTPSENLLDNCLANLPAILNGEIKATDALFPNASMALVEAVYQNNPVADYANAVLIEQLQSYLATANLEPIRVLEIGAGTGGTTRSVLPALKQWQVEEYAYTDLSKAFFNHAKAQYQTDYPFVDTKYLDISKPLAGQNIDIGSYDVVIATNVLHATADIKNTLQNAKACLKQGGVLLINEVVHTSLFTHLTFGLLEGWWLSQDKHLRLAGSPMLSIENWQQALYETGFLNAFAAGDTSAPQQVFCAQSDGVSLQAKTPTHTKNKDKKDNPKATQSMSSTPIQQPQHNAEPSVLTEFVHNALFDIASAALDMAPNELDADESFADYGVDSILAIQMLDEINAKFNVNLPATLLFDYPSIDTLSAYIIAEHKEQVLAVMPAQSDSNASEQAVEAQPSPDSTHNLRTHGSHNKVVQAEQENLTTQAPVHSGKIAIVGMSGQFGDADNLEEFWTMLAEKCTSVKAQTRWDLSRLSANQQSWSKYASLLNDISLFDAPFFSITPQEAMYIDPQQRLFLQEAYKALEDANMITKVAGQNVGVYLGCAQSDYAGLAEEDAPAQVFWGNAGSVIPARVSYFLNLKGPALAIDTACSSSLVALHSACQALNNNEISSALVGGVATLCTPKFSIHAGKAGMLSPDGTCYTFDDRANGFVPGEGAGVLVLKKLEDAERDGDHIYGVILGSATNQDGTTSGITAPSSLSQEQLHRDIYARFDIAPDSIQMIEAHGTGTKLGDPIEFQALTRAFRAHTDSNEFCALGSVKTNIGHCLTAAGVAGVIKTLLAMKHRTIPASLHYEQGNSHINWHNTPFFVNQEAIAWQSNNGQKRRAAVSSFGFSGTNAHVVLEEYQPQSIKQQSTTTQPVIITLSAKSKESLNDKAHALKSWLTRKNLQDSALTNLAFTLQSAREEMDHRMAFTASTIADVQDGLTQFTNKARGHYKQGEVKQGKEILSALDSSDFMRWIEQGDLNKLLALWVVGADIDWPLLYTQQTPALLRLPTYPFAKTSFWLPEKSTHKSVEKCESSAALDFNGPSENVQSTQAFEPIPQLPIKQALNAPSALLHYSANWAEKPLTSTEPATYHRQVVLLGDNLPEIYSVSSTRLSCTATETQAQLEAYTNGLIGYFKQLELQQGTITKKTPSKLLVQVVVKDQTSLLSALNGVLKTAAIEYSNIETQLIAVDDTNNFEHLVEDEAKKQDACIRYQQGQRQVLTFDLQAYQQVDTTTLPWKEDGVYVITGGLGQLGQTFAKEIIQHTQQAHIVFVGRRAHSDAIQSHLDALGYEPSRLSYVSLDIANHDDVNALFASLKAKHGGITGIIHSAGVIKDQLISNKTPQEVAQVFAPKVAGLIALDEASKTCDLDFFVCFSSIAGVFGNMGQADYACANAFMDRFMAARQTQVSQGMRSGLSLSINWPLWSEGGMQVDSLTTSILQSQGIKVMPNEVGIDAFYRIFTLHNIPTQHCFLYGDASKLTQLWHRPSTTTQSFNTGSVEGGKSHTQIRDHVKSIITDITKIDVQDLDDEVDFKDMGFDSIMLMSVVQQLESDTFLNIETLPPALLFEISTINELCDYLAAHQLPTQMDEPLAQSTPASANLHGPMPLSKAQQGLWLLHKQNPQLSTYHVPMVFEVNDLNVDCMQAALNWLSQKHPILSVQLAEVEGLPQQQITGLTPTLVQNHTPVASKSALIDLIQADIKLPFAMTQSHSAHSPLLWRATHWQVNGQLDVVVLVFHHLIIDGVSATLLLEQLWQTYHALVANEPLEQAQPDTGFFTYLEWEKQMLNSEQSTQLTHYWQTQLQGVESELTLAGKQEKQSANKQAKRLELAINSNQVQRIHQFCSSNKINPAAFFLSAFQTLLSAKTQRDDITLGVPVLHRPTSDMANSLGLFVNQLPLRASVNQVHSFSQLALQNQHQLGELIKHSGYPFAEIVRATGAKRAMHSHPIFQIGFAYHNFLKPDWIETNQDLVNAIWPDCVQEPELDLSLEVTPLSHSFKVAFKFDEAVYPSAIIDALAKDYTALIDDVMFVGEQALGSLPVFANLKTLPAAQPTLVDLFEAQAAMHPEHIAVCFGMQSINYRQLNDKANQFANTLLNHPEFKQGTENLIALCAKPSIELIVAILGILKSGAAYVPLDPNSPATRIQHILEDAKPSILVLGTEVQHAGAYQHHQVINLQSALATTVQVANINRASASSLAYIIYTSGSTGKPKGVLVEHHNVCSLFNNTQSLFGFNEQDTWCLFHSYAFDFSVWEIWGALLHGGKLLIPDELTRKESVSFAKFVIDNQVTILNQTPSAFYPLMDKLLASPHNALRKVIFGGEALDVSKLAPWFEQAQPHAELVNMYGITETTVHVTEVTIDASMVYGAQARSTIGRALPGYEVLLLDEQFNPVQAGQVGEIFVAGCGVTRGYHNQPALTDTRFITHSTGKRLYRSGDLARFNESGLLEYMGRADDQVQIRGHRIELGEVQHALQSLSYITDAYVTSAQKQRGQVLVAYIIAPDAPSTAQIRADLLFKLPEYMVPAYFVLVPHFPITPNGKIDKQALSKQLPFVQSQTAMLDAKPNASTLTATPKLTEQSELKAAVTQIWQQVLEVEHIASNVPFFEAGGDSLLANVLTAKFKSQLDVEFPLTQIFQSSTIDAMTDFIAQAQNAHTQAPVQEITSDAANSNSDNQENHTQDIALIGLSCQYPDSQNHTEFWHNLINEKDLLKRLSESTEQGDITWLDSWVEGQDQFDPEFFNISEKNAKTMSYSQRQLLLHAWKAIEDAGYCAENMPNTGVYVSSSGADNPDLNLQDKFKDGQFILNAQDYVASTINQPGTLPTTISYHLGFTGPSLFVHSNCSSSMSAISLACSALKAGEIDYAIVGAACLYPQRYTGYEYEKGLNFAGDARCKVFDEQADGMIGGSGVSVIVLKRADDAVNDADNIYSLIRGIKVNNDGKDKAGFFAPGTKGQMHVIEQTLKASDISPASISYVEAHGTGTALGDPIEFSSLQQVYQQYSGDKQFCGLGAVKSNLGHTDTLAGLTGLIKTSLALYHKKLPASLHFNNVNPHIDLANSPFYMVDSTQDWHTPLLPRRAAVSSFGIGGTNAHAVLEEACNIEHHELESQLINTPAIIVLSAHTQAVLDKQVAQLHDYLAANNLTERDLRRLAFTLQIGRTVMPIRTGFVVSSITELKSKLAAYVPTATTKPTHSIDLENAIRILDHQGILAHWVETGFTNWDFIYQGAKLPKLSLPTYPFALKTIGLGDIQTVQVPKVGDDEQAKMTLKAPVWVKKAQKTGQANSTAADTEHHLVLCDCTAHTQLSELPDTQIHTLHSEHFAIEQKIADYGFQLVELIKHLAKAKKQIKLQLVIGDTASADTQANLYTGFHALLKTASLEHTTLQTQLLVIGTEVIESEVARILRAEQSGFDDKFVRYTKGEREVLTYQAITPTEPKMPFKANGVYLITGGFGGIGQHFIKAISAQPFNKTIVVTGRKPQTHPEVQKQLVALSTSNTQLQYQSVDVSHKMNVLLMVRDILAKHGSLCGVIHAAGIVKDTLLSKKDKHSFSQVLAPKVSGVVALDEATQDLALDFFVCFAGLSGVNGALTQVDYATANAFLDSYMHYRSGLQQRGERQGMSASIDWPYWQDGGMKINPDFKDLLAQTGFTPMPTRTGIDAFYSALQHPQTLVEYTKTAQPTNASSTPNPHLFDNIETLTAELKTGLSGIAADLLGVDANELDPDTDLGDFGADSIAFITFINQVNTKYHLTLSPSVLFMHSTLNSILAHILDEHSDKLVGNNSEHTELQKVQVTEQTDETDDRIAIIGISAQFPQANNIDAFWQNLANQTDCVTEFDWASENTDTRSQQPLPKDINWLGRLERNQHFDPLFFNIAPAESDRIKLQESLLMSHVWQCIEDAGYDPKSLAGTNTGLFIGCQAGYHEGLITSSAYAPNRMSYFLDLHGPSEGVDTTCSSSLVAIHKAVQAIQNGECDQAIVGGVNVIDSPSASIAMHDIGALSPTGRCRTFSANADGIVRGEGVGMIFIKKLSESERDKDHIYGTILGSAINHGGKSQGFTVPNAKAQTRLLDKAWQDAGVDPSTLSYIECHGTGTSLGDPVELDALKAAYKKISTATDNAQTCALGSVKSNIGHLEIAAGIAGVIKVLLQLKHQTLVPSLHVGELNPYLGLEHSPFKVQTEMTPWQSEQQRRAGVSSFGISGVNAHIVLEEYSKQPVVEATAADTESAIVLSAASQSALEAKVKALNTFVEQQPTVSFESLVYTLQIGRTAHKYRTGWTVSSVADLKQKLGVELESNTLMIKKVPSTKAEAITDNDVLKLAHNPAALLRFWLEGHTINWSALYKTPVQKVSLPSTPFLNTKPPAAPWLLLENQWQAMPLSCPLDWQAQLQPLLANKKGLIVAKDKQSAEPLRAKLNGCDVDIVHFSELETFVFNQDTLPSFVYFIAEQAETKPANIKPLYEFIQAIAKFDKHAMQMFYALPNSQTNSSYDDLSALLRSYTMRNPAHVWSLVEFADNCSNWADKLLQELVCTSLNSDATQPNQVKYQDQSRFGLALNKASLPANNSALCANNFKQQGVYLIAGALGELGMALCEQLLTQFNATLILLGRRKEAQCLDSLNQLKACGRQSQVHYLSADVACEQSLEEVHKYMDEHNLPLNGILHLGTAFKEDENNWADFEQAMQVKVQGSINLDKVFAHTDLDLFVMFSSMAVFGSLNHLSYSYGNGFQNAFAHARQQQVLAGERHGKSLAINWGYWHSDDPIKSIENGFAEKKGYQLITMPKAFSLMQHLLNSEVTNMGALLSTSPDKIYQNTVRLMSREVAPADTVTHLSGSQIEVVNSADIRGAVIQIVSNVIGIAADELDLDCDLYEYGFDSICLLKTFQQLKEQLNIELQADAFKNMNTIAAFIEDIEKLYATQHTDSQSEESQQKPDFILDAGFTPTANTTGLTKAYEGDVKSVLLTGATGFLGSHILQQLMDETDATIYCIVRVSSLNEAKQRIVHSAKSYQLSPDMSRIEPMLGDMEKPQLGLSDKDWQSLCEHVQHIVHTASYVNHIQPYFAFKKSVAGTNQLLQMATTQSLKMMHFVSSTTASTQVKNSHFSVNPIEDFIDVTDAELICSGYGQSKWVQEENIRQASECGVPYTIYRFAQISGSSQTGIGNTDDIFHRILKMMMRTPVQPAEVPYLLDIIPVDKAAAAIVLGMNDEQKRNTVFHVANKTPLPVTQFYDMAKSQGLRFEQGEKHAFIESCKHYIEHATEGNTQVIMDGLLTQRPGYDEYLFEAYLMPMAPYDKDNYLALVEQYQVGLDDWEALFNTYFKQWREDLHYQVIWQEAELPSQ